MAPNGRYCRAPSPTIKSRSCLLSRRGEYTGQIGYATPATPKERRNSIGKKSASVKEVFATYGALFASVATLFCCALPALLVLLGFGLTSVLTFFTAIPGWEAAGQYTISIFVIGGAVLAPGFYFAYRRQRAVEGEVCEIPQGGTESACSTATRWNRRVLWFSLFLYTLALVMDVWGIEWMKAHGFFNH